MQNNHRKWTPWSGTIYTLTLCALVALAGCAIHVKNERMVDGFVFDPGKEARQAEMNFTLLQQKYGHEWQLNKGDKNAPPALGLAMSGGGMRSAAFNVGVLKGLHKMGQLDDLDILSSVSGGGYALSWYYLQRFSSGESDAVLFDPEGRFQKHLEENGRIITHSDLFIVEAPEYLLKLGINVVAIPLHWLANGLFDWNKNLAPYRWFYQNALEREFHLTPAADGSGFLNAKSVAGVIVGVDTPVGFPEMRGFIESERLPPFVINTTAAISDSMQHYGADFGNAIFEFTPYAFGSDAYGYRSEAFPIDIHTAVAVSGAAADSAILPPKAGILLSALNTDLGYNIPNHNITDPAKIAGHNLLPFPLYYTYRSNNDIRGTSIYLTDGGHSENLGAFALIRRMCRHIIIVDAEHDPDYRFAGYRKLKERLKKELRVDFSLPDIDTGLRIDAVDFNGKESLYDGVMPDGLAQRIGLSDDVHVRFDKEVGLWQLKDKGPDGKSYYAKREDRKLNIYKVYDGSKPVMEGTISWFPLKIGAKIEKVSLKVTYVKLSLDTNNLDAYPQSVSQYYRSKKGWFKELTGYKNAPFPQEDTSDISYGKAQFSAYRDLGEHIVVNYVGRLRRAE
ncbi:MAG: hypothetical protein QNJ22_22655 [Desulfosarcinaceae bacterium]|nr:hypothetical protein [Desulfosarcinaceae bacterium]